MTRFTRNSPHQTRIAIIGAGPSGLVTARWLQARGFVPVILEAARDLGGQWNAANPGSSTWPGMRTNTSRILTAFADLDHPEGTPVFPVREAMHAYLTRYADRFGLIPHIRFGTRVTALERAENGGWRLQSLCDGVTREEAFSHVIVATGRHVTPDIPEIPGLAEFSGFLGAIHSAEYARAARYSGARIVVAGCSISALEIATDLAGAGAAAVTAAMRKQRYVIPKIMAGVPADNVMFTRAAALAAERLPLAAQAAGLKAAVLAAAGNPAQYGAAAPDDHIFAAGLTQSQGFLPAVAEGKIRTAPWIRAVAGRSVTFADGTTTEADAIIFGTGFRHDLSWLAPDIAQAVGLGSPTLDLFAQTLHPDLPGLAFVGQYDLIGPYFPVLELQARFVAGVIAGQIALPPAEAQRRAMAEQRAAALPPAMPMHSAAMLFAGLAGCAPDPKNWPAQERALLFGPLTPVSFRLEGPDACPDAAARVQAAAASLGRITSASFTADELALIEALNSGQAEAA